ncbi:MAG: hypothetical protein IAF94_04475 [Pirellulaceae bacterium]|nr:hypothetical protein [Pirellulaceae bacterium]
MNIDKIAAIYAIVLCLLTAIATFFALIYQVIFGAWEWLPVTFALHLISVIGYTAIMLRPRPDA